MGLKRRKLSFLFLSFIVLTLFITALPIIDIPPVRGDGEGWLTGYNVRKSITVSQTAIGEDYPIRLVVCDTAGTDSGHNVFFDGEILQSNFADVAFTESDGETLASYWQDSHLTYTDVNATFFVRVSGNLTASSQTLFIYVGNYGASSLSNGTATFPILFESFDDYTNGDLNGQGDWTGSTNWDVQNSVVKEGTKAIQQAGGTSGVNINHTLTTGTLVFAQAYGRTTGGDIVARQTDFYLCQDGKQITGMGFGNGDHIYHLVSAAWENLPLTLQENVWYSLKFVVKSNSTHEAWVNGVNYTVSSAANNNAVTTSINKLMIDHYDNLYTNYWDCIFVGKYIDPEPTLSWGTLEGNPFVFEPLTVSESTTVAGASCVFTCVWNTSAGLASAVLRSNNTGQWANTTAAITGNTSQATIVLNSTVGTVISYSWYGVDANDATFPPSFFYGLPSSWTISDNYNLAAAGSGWEVMNPQDPFIVDMGEGVWRMYYAAYNGSCQNIGYATSTDGGATWSKQGLVFASTGLGIELDGISAPQIVVLPNGTWLMYYHSIQSGVSRACLATSSDGLGWTRSPDNPLIDVVPATFYSERIDPETVVYDLNNPYPFTMMFGAYDGVDYQGGFAYSYDGVDWTVAPDPCLVAGDAGQWDDTAVYPVAMYNTGSTFYLIYQGLKDNWQLGYAASPDGQNWTKYESNPVIGLSTWATVSTENPCNPINYGNGTLFIEFCGANGGSGAIPAGPYYLGFATANDPLFYYEAATVYYMTTTETEPTPSPSPTPFDDTVPSGQEGTIDLYYHADVHTVNEVSGYAALLTVPDEEISYQISTAGSASISWGFRVYLQFETGASELTGGSPEAVITQAGDNETLETATISLSETRLSFGRTALKFVLYSSWDSGTWTPQAVYISEELFYSSILDSTATVSLYLVRNESGGYTYATLYWGTSTYLSGVSDLNFRLGTTVDWQQYYLNEGNFLSFLTIPYVAVIGNAFYALIFFGIMGSIYIRYKQLSALVLFVVMMCGSGAAGAVNLIVGDLFMGILWVACTFGLALIYWRLFR